MSEHGETDLVKLLAELEPVLLEGTYVFVSQPERGLDSLNFHPLATFREAEGVTIILLEQQAREMDWEPSLHSRLIRLSVHSNLAAVGLLARVTGTLAAEGVPVNVLSAFYHDYLLVPIEAADMALRVLNQIQDQARVAG